MKAEKKISIGEADICEPILDRRHFLVCSGLLATTAPLSVLGEEDFNEMACWSTPQAATFQQMPYISFDGTGEQYMAPRVSGANKSTRHYVDSISDEEYLRRHWFI